MPAVKLSPLFNDAQLDNDGLPLAGGQVYWYLSGTATLVTVYAESTGSTVNTNPVILNVRGEPVSPIYLPTGNTYKAVLKDANGSLIRTVDDIAGINDVSVNSTISEWVLYSGTATFVSTIKFSVVGDATAIFDNARRIKTTCSGSDLYGTINGAPVYAAGVTTVTVTLDSGVFDTSISTVYYGFLDPAHPSFDTSGVNTNTKSGIQSQTWTAFTTGGTSGTYTLTPNPAITAYTAGQRFNVTFNATGNGSDIINVNGLGAKNLKQYDAFGAKTSPNIIANQISDIVYDGTDWVILDGLVIPVSVGSIIAFSGTSVPLGYLACPTSATNISRTTYAKLFAAISTTWGAGDGSTTFGMPYFPAGYSPIAGTPGSTSLGAVIAHTHLTQGGASGSYQSGGAYGASSSGNGNYYGVISITGGTANLGAGSTVLMCVKY